MMKFIKKQSLVTAVQYTVFPDPETGVAKSDNIEEVRAFVEGGEVNPWKAAQNSILVNAGQGDMQVQPSDIITRDENGVFAVYDMQEFNKEFVCVGDILVYGPDPVGPTGTNGPEGPIDDLGAAAGPEAEEVRVPTEVNPVEENKPTGDTGPVGNTGPVEVEEKQPVVPGENPEQTGPQNEVPTEVTDNN
jgi:hypothetical protein